MSVDAAITTAEHVVRVLQQTAPELREVGLPEHARLLESIASQLDAACRRALQAPADLTPPEGIYLADLRTGLDMPRAMLTPDTIRWTLDMLMEARSLVRRLLQAAEITGDVEVIARAQRWLEMATLGPSDPRGDV